ncbi:unnamed protein product [Pleuronectes platessa]|uniref:Uncharacterized protein n=1 Tax=Pleuronectes platessa TaxID=8262 RepID=A0A9N7U844_PLEPL|nr:unnamed protein product [Pleuronectes platessa]
MQGVGGSETDSCVKLTGSGSSQGRDVACWDTRGVLTHGQQSGQGRHNGGRQRALGGIMIYSSAAASSDLLSLFSRKHGRSHRAGEGENIPSAPVITRPPSQYLHSPKHSGVNDTCSSDINTPEWPIVGADALGTSADGLERRNTNSRGPSDVEGNEMFTAREDAPHHLNSSSLKSGWRSCHRLHFDSRQREVDKGRKKEGGRRKEEEGRRKEEEGKRKKERGRRKEEEGKRKKERGRRKEQMKRKEVLGMSDHLSVTRLPVLPPNHSASSHLL